MAIRLVCAGGDHWCGGDGGSGNRIYRRCWRASGGCGVSGVASAIAGGGAGSYMAGLSIVGGWFGGNAMLGAALLNGLSAGIISGLASHATVGGLSLLGGVTIEQVAQKLTKKITVGQFQGNLIEISATKATNETLMQAAEVTVLNQQEQQQSETGEVIASGLVLAFPLQPSRGDCLGVGIGLPLAAKFGFGKECDG